jgi:hypothetical protein
MRHYILILLLALSVNAKAQIDTVFLTSGRIITGTAKWPWNKSIEFSVDGNSVIDIGRDSIDRVVVRTSLQVRNEFHKKGYQISNVKREDKPLIESYNDITMAGRALISSAKYQYAGYIIGGVGLIGTAIGAATGTPELTYVGIGFSGVGLIFQLIAPAQKIRAGNFLIKVGG